MKKNTWISALGISALALALGACTITTDDGNGGSSGSGQGGSAGQDASAQGGNAQGGSAGQDGGAQDGAAGQGGSAQGGAGQGGSPELTDCNKWYPDKVADNSCEVCVRANCCEEVKKCWNDKGDSIQHIGPCKPSGECIIEKKQQKCKDDDADGCAAACTGEAMASDPYNNFATCVKTKCTDKCFPTRSKRK